jgi:hypothetical protein
MTGAHQTGTGPIELKLNWRKPGPVATAFVLDRHPVSAIMGPIGSGKTSAALIKAITLAQAQRPSTLDGVRKFKLCVVRDTYRGLWKTTIRTWQRWLAPSIGKWIGGEGEPAQHHIRFGLRDGTHVDFTVEFVAIGEQRVEDVLRGYEPTAFYLNEADLLGEEVFIYARGRAGRYPTIDEGGPSWFGLWCDCNAPDIDNWTYRVFVEDRPDSFAFFRQPSGFSPQAENLEHLPPGYYEQQAKGAPEWYVRRMIRAEFGYSRDGKVVFPEFEDATHVAPEPLRPIRELPLHLGLDAGRTPAAVFAQRLGNGQWRVLDELCIEDIGAQRFGEQLNARLAERYAGMTITGRHDDGVTRVWCDPAATVAGDSDEASWMEIVSDTTKLRIRGAPTNDLTPRLEAVRHALRPIDARTPGFLLSPTCKVLRKGFNSHYRYRRLRIANSERYDDRPDKQGPWSHPQDALQYLLLGGGSYLEITGRAKRREGHRRQSHADDDYDELTAGGARIRGRRQSHAINDYDELG